MLARWPALPMKSWLMPASLIPAPHTPTFSPVWAEFSPHDQSRCTPLPWKIVPAAAMACAWPPAMPARQPLQLSGGRPADALSWLIRDCCAEPITRGGAAVTGRAAAGAAAAQACGAASGRAGGGGRSTITATGLWEDLAEGLVPVLVSKTDPKVEVVTSTKVSDLSTRASLLAGTQSPTRSYSCPCAYAGWT